MIRYESERRLWILEGRQSALVLGLADVPGRSAPAGADVAAGNSPERILLVTWHGSRLNDTSEYPEAALDPGWASFSSGEGLSAEAWPGWGGARYGECALKATRADGFRDLRLSYRDYDIDGELLRLRFTDLLFGLAVTLEYEVFPEEDLVRTRAVVTNTGSETVFLERFFSAMLYPRRDLSYRLTHLAGHWAGETRLVRDGLAEGLTVLESRRGFTSQHANPFFALDPRGETGEESGEVWFGSLAWSGSWKISIERDSFGLVRVAAGMNDFDFSLPLPPALSTDSPWFLFGYTARGFGDMSRRLHRWQRTFLPAVKAYGAFGVTANAALPRLSEHQDVASSGLRPVLYNSWEATAFSVNEADQIRLAELASKLGVELFVMDDGWFGARNSDRAGLGDWQVNRGKFPNGLAPLIEAVRSKGMKFGLWVEPEMVNADSDLYRAHPDWVYCFPGRESTELRNQLVLNLAIPEVEAWVLETMDRLLTENDISFIKWDLNRSIAEPGTIADFSSPSPLPAVGRQNTPDSPERIKPIGKSVWVAHTRALWRIVDTLRERHPGVAFQSCSGGGGRVDLGILERFDQVWPSDNTDALDRLRIQHGFSFAYGAHLMEAWVTGERNWLTGRTVPLRFRFHAAMAGVLGIGEDIGKWDEAEFGEAERLVGLYKNIRPLIQAGDAYRLSPLGFSGGPVFGSGGPVFGDDPNREGLSGLMYVSADRRRAVLFAWLPRDRYAHHVPALGLAGLAPDFHYRIRRLDPETAMDSPHARFAPGGAVSIRPEGEGSGFGSIPMSGGALVSRGLATGLRGDCSSGIFEFAAAD